MVGLVRPRPVAVDYPPFPENYFTAQNRAILEEYRVWVDSSRKRQTQPPEFPQQLMLKALDNTWHDSAEAVIDNWIGKVYQLTHIDRRKPFRDDINPDDPLGLG